MRRRRWLLPLLLLLVLAGGGAWYLLAARPAVEAVRAERREVVELVIASGRLRAVRQSALGAEVSGVVDEVLVDDGDTVRAGVLLVRFRQEDARQRVQQARLAIETAQRELERLRAGAAVEEVRRADAEVARAGAALVLAEQEHRRAQELFERGLIARAALDQVASTLDQARAGRRAAEERLQELRNQPRAEDVQVVEARLREARAALRAAEVELDKRTILAPFPGLVVDRKVEPGQSVAPGTALLTLADMRRTELLVETDENNLARLRPGQRAIVVAPAYPAQPFRAVLRQIGPEVDSARGIVTLRLDPEALPPWTRPDMTVDVSVEVARVPDAIAVPATSLLDRSGAMHVVAIREGRARLVEVRVRGRNPEWAAVEGLEAGALVLRHAADAAPGQAVRVRAPAP